MGDKRKDPPPSVSGGTVIKRARPEDETLNSGALTVLPGSSKENAVIGTIKRTSGLQAPIMLLTGHAGEVFTSKFDHSGQHIASAGSDRQIFLWNTYGDCKNYGILKGHLGAILEINWSRDNLSIFSCSVDKSLGIWDVITGERVRRWRGHSEFINSCAVARSGQEIVVSGGDDGAVKIWDQREKNAVETFENPYQVTAVCFSATGDIIFSGGIDNEIKAWDIRKKEIVYTLPGHIDTVTGLRVSPDGNYLLSNGMDSTVRIWDIKPFGPTNRNIKILEGAPHGFEKNLLRPAWSNDGLQVAAGSSDRTATVWEVSTGKILYKLPGHKGCVNEVDFHPKEPIILSGGTDRVLFIGELEKSK